MPRCLEPGQRSASGARRPKVRTPDGQLSPLPPTHSSRMGVLRHLGISPEHLDRQMKELPVPPFALCTYELFERYAETVLRREHADDLWAGYSYKKNNLGNERYQVRPDFLVIRKREIIDCKYKFLNEELEGSERADVYQVVSYSRHQAVREKLGGCDPSKLTLLYPEIVSDKSKWGQQIPWRQSDKSFEIPLERRRLSCPAVAPNTSGSSQ